MAAWLAGLRSLGSRLRSGVHPAAVDTSWLLNWTNPSSKDGRPWGRLTAMAARQQNGQVPWDAGCVVEPIIGGFDAMVALREALDALIRSARDAAKAGKPAGQRGLVYIADWRVHGLRDLSSNNWWGTQSWVTTAKPAGAKVPTDQTFVGLLLRLIAAGVTVRVLVWAPYGPEVLPDLSQLPELMWLAEIVKWANDRATAASSGAVTDLAVVGMDSRVADHLAAAHHQKMCVIRYWDEKANAAVAFCGGVDLTFTRRDAPQVAPSAGTGAVPWQDAPAAFGDGDWQSGDGMPWVSAGWPQGPLDDGLLYPIVSGTGVNAAPPSRTPAGDLETGVYGSGRLQHQIWHDQHLRLQGPIVSTLQHQFVERWNDGGEQVAMPFPLTGINQPWGVLSNRLLTSSKTGALPVPASPVDPVSNAASAVQMWRTIPVRRDRNPIDMFSDGEFTVMAGYVHAVSHARNLIWIFDQYFWSVPYCRLLNQQLKTNPYLAVIIVLPPYADSGRPMIAGSQHEARYVSVQAVLSGLDAGQKKRVSIWNLWDYRIPQAGGTLADTRGIYVHAKSHTYDGTLLVCGSANINRRSLTGDSELACAVVDPAVTTAHMKRLWTLLFPKEEWPAAAAAALAGDPAASPGPQFMTKFAAAASLSKDNEYFVLADQAAVNNEPFRLPNTTSTRKYVSVLGQPPPFVYSELLESNSVPIWAELAPVFPNLNLPTLADVSDRLEGPQRATWGRQPTANPL